MTHDGAPPGETAPANEPATHPDGGPLFWVACLVGWGVIAFSVVGALDEANRTAPESSVKWFIGGLVLHDMIWLPIALIAGAAMARVLPEWLKHSFCWALATSAILIAVSMPFVLGYGRRADTPSLLPRNYAAGLWAYLAATIVIAVVWAAADYRRKTRTRASISPEPSATPEPSEL